jgi:DNA topoisomerase I
MLQCPGNPPQAIEHVAARLGFTASVCRKCRGHPDVIDACSDRILADCPGIAIDPSVTGELPGLSAEEATALVFLQRRRREKDSP